MVMTSERVSDRFTMAAVEFASCCVDHEDEQAIVDQALGVVADYAAELAAAAGMDTRRPTVAALRAGPLGRDLALLDDAACRRRALPLSEVRRAASRVRTLLLRPAAADDYVVPAWFRASALGQLLNQAERNANAAGGLMAIAAAADRLDVDGPTVERWIERDMLAAVWDDEGNRLLYRSDIEQRLAMTQELIRGFMDADQVVDERPDGSSSSG